MEFRLLRLNLTEWKAREEKVPESILRKYIGGRGLGAYLALKEIPPGIDPFSPENKIYILTGPVVGTAAFETG
ncbi:MAG: aldehyde ferredoxin oxidoreductase, partial [Desulfurococcales archaeon]|nr:aldehyde ferredoxin oxidoreductase [Desulfurococcales archaeon]